MHDLSLAVNDAVGQLGYRFWNKLLSMESNNKNFEPFYGNMVLYSPGIDRIICLDRFDPYTAVEAAQILSAKLPLVVGVVRSMDIDATRCLEYSIKDKELMFAYSSIFYSRQWPSFRRLSGGFEYLGWPLDYKDEPARGYLVQLRDYAEFVCQCVKATRITNLIFNVLPMEHIVGNYLDQYCPDTMTVPADNTEAVGGVSANILKILYEKDSVTDAISAINDFWRTIPDVVLYRNQFYQLLGIEQPEDVKAMRFSGKITGFAV